MRLAPAPGCTLFLLLLSPLAAQEPDLYEDTQLRSLSLTFHQKDWWSQLTANYKAKKVITADLSVDGLLYKNVGVRFRGNTSYTLIGSSQKKPFKIVMDAFVPGQELYGYRTLNLDNSYRDPSFLRETLGYWIYRQMMAAPRANYVKLSLNGKNWGVYVNVQQINKDFGREWMPDNDGNRYRGENKGYGVPPNDSALKWLGASNTRYAAAYELKTENSTTPWTDLIRVCNVLNNSGKLLDVELPRVFDVDAALRYLVGLNLLPTLDTYIGKSTHNFYLYNDAFHGQMRPLPWDMNATLGGEAWMTITQRERLDIWYRATETDRPMLSKVLAVPEFRARYLAHYKAALDHVYRWDRIAAQAAVYRQLIAAEVAKDPKRLYPASMFDANLTKSVQIASGDWVAGLKSHVENRVAFLRAHSDLKVPTAKVELLGHMPLIPAATEPVTVLAQVKPSPGVTVLLHERHQGPHRQHAMYDDGKHGDGAAGDGIFAAAIPAAPWGARKEYFVEARTGTGNGMRSAFAPLFAGHRPATYRVARPNGGSPLRISEFVAKNANGIKDQQGEREDWIEICNGSATPVPVGGLYLTDDLAQPTKWKIPVTLDIHAGRALLIWADDEVAEGPMHASFRLDGDGEEIALFDRDGKTLIDVFEFGRQIADRSTGRLHDVDPVWVTFDRPTPGTANDSAACGVRSYNGLRPWDHPLQITVAGDTKIGSSPRLDIDGASSVDVVVAVFSLAGTRAAIHDSLTLLVAAPPGLFVMRWVDAAGQAQIAMPIPNDPRLVGDRAFVQAFAMSSRLSATPVRGSNALEMVVCPQ